MRPHKMSLQLLRVLAWACWISLLLMLLPTPALADD